jgi:dGTPase
MNEAVSSAGSTGVRARGVAQTGHDRIARLSGKARTDKADVRSAAQRDKDRILYSSAWRRLGGVTQVITPFEDSALLHNRLTHSEKVAQVARSIAERLVGDDESHALLTRLGGIDVDVCEAAAMAHDLGHPPFGHIGETVLDRLARTELDLPDGFEGNAQSLRIVTIGKIRSSKHEGLDLTLATLAAIAKYPWKRTPTLEKSQHKTAIEEDTHYRRHWRKFNYYNPQWHVLEKSRGFTAGRIGHETQTLEASVMDAADDISYAVHDLEDFYLAGILNTPSVVADLRVFMDSQSKGVADATPFGKLSRRLSVDYPDRFDMEVMAEAVSHVASSLDSHFRIPSGTAVVEASARQAGSALIGRYIGHIALNETPLWEHGPHIGLTTEAWHEVQVLKEITKWYVIQRPDIALLQRGQQHVLEELVRMLAGWVKSDQERLPRRLLDEVVIAEGLLGNELDEGYDDASHARRGEVNRAILDYLCGLGDQQCLSLYYKLSGIQVHRVGMTGAF